jgi:hypothetical protein
LNSEKIWKIGKKSKLNSEKIWKIHKKIVKRYENYERKISWIVIISLFNFLFFPIFHIISLFNLLFFSIFHIFSLFNLLFFHIFQIFPLFNLPFSEMIWKIQKKIAIR